MLKKLALSFSLLFLISLPSYGFEITSSAFTQGGNIPQEYTCDGSKVNPPLAWSNLPANTKSLVLIVEDPDAPQGVYDHWVLFNLPANTHDLSQNISALPAGTVQGSNSLHKEGYIAPCPPDRQHRYFFKLYALNTVLFLKPGANKQEVENAMRGHVIGTTQLMGKYQRVK